MDPLPTDPSGPLPHADGSPPAPPMDPTAVGTDLGNPPERRTPWWLWAFTLTILAVVVVFQRPPGADAKQDAEAAAGLGKIEAPETSELILFGKLIVFMAESIRTQGSSGGLGQEQSAMLLGFSDGAVGWGASDPLHPPDPNSPPKSGPNPAPAADRLRAAIIAAEVLSPEKVDWRLQDVERTLGPDSPLRGDVAAVRQILQIPGPEGTTPSPDLTPEQRDGLKARHGWFADLVLTRDQPTADVRARAAAAGTLFMLLLLLIGGVVALAALTGFVLLLVGVIKWSDARRRPGGFWRFRRPDLRGEWPAIARPSGEGEPLPRVLPKSIWLETLAVFLCGFLGLKIMLEALGHVLGPGQAVGWAALGGQWLLVPTIFWPVIRGMPWARWREEIGWNRGQGVVQEIGAGIVGYLAGLPLYFAMAVFIVVLTYLWAVLFGTAPGRPAAGRVFELVEGGPPLMILLIYLLATVWAPVVEESVFRGSLFRHLRGRVALVPAALLTAAVFAVLHGYVIQGLFVVGTLGFWFALLREWRGSIIACVTAHAIHNGFVLLVVITLMSFARA